MASPVHAAMSEERVAARARAPTGNFHPQAIALEHALASAAFTGVAVGVVGVITPDCGLHPLQAPSGNHPRPIQGATGAAASDQAPDSRPSDPSDSNPAKGFPPPMASPPTMAAPAPVTARWVQSVTPRSSEIHEAGAGADRRRDA